MGEYVIIKKPELVETGDNVRISDFAGFRRPAKSGLIARLQPGRIFREATENLNLRWAVIPVWPQVSEYG